MSRTNRAGVRRQHLPRYYLLRIYFEWDRDRSDATDRIHPKQVQAKVYLIAALVCMYVNVWKFDLLISISSRILTNYFEVRVKVLWQSFFCCLHLHIRAHVKGWFVRPSVNHGNSGITECSSLFFSFRFFSLLFLCSFLLFCSVLSSFFVLLPSFLLSSFSCGFVVVVPFLFPYLPRFRLFLYYLSWGYIIIWFSSVLCISKYFVLPPHITHCTACIALTRSYFIEQRHVISHLFAVSVNR